MLGAMSVPGGPPAMHPQPPGAGFPSGGGPPRLADPAATPAKMLAVSALLMFVGLLSKSWVTASAGFRDMKVAIGPLGAEACAGSICHNTPTDKLPGDIVLVMWLAVIAGFASVALAGWLGGATLLGKRDKYPPVKLAQLAFGLATFSFVFFIIRMFSEGTRGLGPGWASFPAIIGVVLASVGLKKLRPFLPEAGAPQAPYGQASYGQPPHGQPASTAPHPYGQPAAGHGQQPPQAYGQPLGAPPYGQPQGAAPYGQPQAAAPPYGQPQAAAPYGQPQGAPGYGQPQSMPSHVPPPQGMAAPPGSPPQQQAVPNCSRCGQPLQFVAQYQRWFCAREQQYV
jgi:hypothetical protein